MKKICKHRKKKEGTNFQKMVKIEPVGDDFVNSLTKAIEEEIDREIMEDLRRTRRLMVRIK